MSLNQKQHVFTISVRQPCIAQTPYLKSAFSSSSPSCSNYISCPHYVGSSMPFQQYYFAKSISFLSVSEVRTSVLTLSVTG